MIPYTMPTQILYRNDLWEDVYHIGPMLDDNDNPPDAPCLSCRMQIRDIETDELGYELSSDPGVGEGTITIVDSTNYEFDIAPQDLILEEGTWVWDFETFTTDDFTGSSRTWLKGTFKVMKDISHD